MIRVIVMVAIVVCATASCGGVLRRLTAPHSASPGFAWVDPDAPAITVAVGDVHYAVRREPSGVVAALRAVVVAGDVVYAAGDSGVVLRRTARGSWIREPTPTTRRLRALLDVHGNGSEILAVGDAGTVLRRSASGSWTLEPVPTTADLYDISRDISPFVVGDRGTLLERTPGGWRAIATHTAADLRRFTDHVAVGRGGAIVDCAVWNRHVAGPDPLVCVPRPSPTHADLLASLGSGAEWRAYGAGGVSMRAVRRGPLDAVLDVPLPGAATLTATDAVGLVAAWKPGNESYDEAPVPPILVGSAGTIEFLGVPTVHFVVPDAPDLLGVAVGLGDVFVVGAGGTIVHLQAPDLPVTEIILI